jgi:hypothetical protein
MIPIIAIATAILWFALRTPAGGHHCPDREIWQAFQAILAFWLFVAVALALFLACAAGLLALAFHLLAQS